MHKYQLRHAAGLWWLLDMEQSGKDYRRPVRLNDSAALIWQLYEKGKSLDDIARILSDRYELPCDEVRGDVEQFLDTLKEL